MRTEILDLAKEVFDQDTETKSYIPDYNNDIGIIIDAYVFVVQTKDGFNNVIFSKVNDENSKLNLREVFGIFYLYCVYYNFEFLRVEGNPRRYNFLKKMFPLCSFVQEDNSERNIFYVKLLD